jgi:CTP synthase (UTP-ammonia lyase)
MFNPAPAWYLERMTRIAVLGEFNPENPTHASTNAALRHASDRAGVEVATAWLRTDTLDDDLFDHFSAIWVAPGSPYADLEKTLAAIRFARENAVPCFGTCGGFQHMVVEYARNVLGVENAQHAEYDPNAADAFIAPLACSLRGRSMTLALVPDSQVATLYGSTGATEQYYCNFGVDPARAAQLKSGPLKVTGSDAEGEIRAIELPGHPFFVGTLYVPQARSLPGRPHPLVSGFVRAAVARARRMNAG